MYLIKPPQALNLIVKLFPEPAEQSRAIAAFGATGAIANSKPGKFEIKHIFWKLTLRL